MAYVAEHRRPGEPILAALPAFACLELNGGIAAVQHLAGPQNRHRAERSIRPAPDGRSLDYWAGGELIVSPSRLCGLRIGHPDTWVVIDRERMTPDWAYAGPIADILTGATTPVPETAGGALVRHPTAAGLHTACG